MHEKHANTFFPGDKVRRLTISGDGTKTAGSIQGEVVDGDPSSGKVKVAWPDGTDNWVDTGDLSKG